MSKYVFLLVLGCVACIPRQLDQEALIQYIKDEENGLVSVFERQGRRLEMSYKPTDALFSGELKLMSSDDEREAFLRQYESMDYFVLRLSDNGREVENRFAFSNELFTDAIQYLEYGIASDLNMVCKGDTLQPMNVSLIRSYGTSEATTLLLAFESGLRSKDGSVSLTLTDTKFGSGVTTFTFDTRAIKKVPKVIL